MDGVLGEPTWRRVDAGNNPDLNYLTRETIMFIEGMIIAYSGSLENSDLRDRIRHLGWLVCDGAQVERARYPRLFAAIGVTYGAGESSATFKLPDLRGVFLRGLDDGRGLDRSRRLGAFQDDAVQPHTHKFGNRNANESGTTIAVWFATDNPSNYNEFETSRNDGPETRPKNMPTYYLIRVDVDLFGPTLSPDGRTGSTAAV